MLNEVRDTFAPAQLATASLNFGVGRSRSLCVKSPIEARTPATQNFCQLLSFGCEFLKSNSISLFVFFGEFYRVSLDPVIFRLAGLRRTSLRGRGDVPRLAVPPAHDYRSLNSGNNLLSTLSTRSTLSYLVIPKPIKPMRR
jgi:hypothetical protein